MLYEDCKTCGGEGAWLNAAIPPESMYKDCPDCKGCGFVPVKPAESVEALAYEVREIVRDRWQTNICNAEIAAKIAAFCEKREGDLRQEVEKLRQALNDLWSTENDNKRLREALEKIEKLTHLITRAIAQAAPEKKPWRL